MKKFLMIVPAALLAACATTGAQKPVTVDPTVMAQQQRIAELEARLEALQTHPAEQVPQQVEQPVVVQQQVRMTPPPAQPEPNGPPQHWGWLYNSPRGCESGPFKLRVVNWQYGFARVFLDGKELDVRGANGLLAFPAPDGTMMTAIPPQTTRGQPTIVNVCLANLGEHTISGVLYAGRMGELKEVAHFSVNVRYGHDAQGGHVFPITDSILEDVR